MGGRIARSVDAATTDAGLAAMTAERDAALARVALLERALAERDAALVNEHAASEAALHVERAASEAVVTARDRELYLVRRELAAERAWRAAVTASRGWRLLERLWALRRRLPPFGARRG